jgi:hypothetical protein
VPCLTTPSFRPPFALVQVVSLQTAESANAPSLVPAPAPIAAELALPLGLQLGEAAAVPGAEYRKLVSTSAALSAGEQQLARSEAIHADAIFAPVRAKTVAPLGSARPSRAVPTPVVAVDDRFVDDSDDDDDNKMRGPSAATIHPVEAEVTEKERPFDPYHDPRLVYRNTSAAVMADPVGNAKDSREASSGLSRGDSSGDGASAPLYKLLRPGHRVRALYPQVLPLTCARCLYRVAQTRAFYVSLLCHRMASGTRVASHPSRTAAMLRPHIAYSSTGTLKMSHASA